MKNSIIAILFILVALSAGTFLLTPQTYEQIGNAYGKLEENNVSGTAITITDADTYYPWVTSSVGESRNMSLSAATDNITIVTSGAYLVIVDISFTGSNSTDFLWAVHRNDSAVAGLSVQRDMSTASKIGSATRSGIISLDAGDTLNVEVSSTAGTKSVTVHYVSLVVAMLR